MLISAMFTTRLRGAVCGMHGEVLTVELPVVESCTLGRHWEMKGTRDFPGSRGKPQQLLEWEECSSWQLL